jgi:tricorn protease
MSMKRSLLAALLLLTFATSSYAQEVTLFQKPTVNRTHIVFVYAGDLWSVPREGGDAKRLTNGVGEETDPFFHPTESQIAFTGEYDGNTDVYVDPCNGRRAEAADLSSRHGCGGRMDARWQACVV